MSHANHVRSLASSALAHVAKITTLAAWLSQTKRACYHTALTLGNLAILLPESQLPIGDGWFRLMSFDLAGAPKVSVKTYSAHYAKYSGEVANYTTWHKKHEHPELSDEDFLLTGDFALELTGFHQRFAIAKES